MGTMVNEIEKTLRYLYYKAYGTPSFFTGDAKILLKGYRNGGYKPSIKLKDVKHFLSTQSVYGLHKKQINKFERNKIYSMFQGDIFAMDIADMRAFSKVNDDYKYILIGIDAFSKKGYAVPVSNKKAANVLNAFKKMRGDIKYTIYNISVDNGNEFLGKFKKWCKNKGINLYTVQGEQKNAIAERFILTIKTRLWRCFRYNGNHRWLEVLPKILNSYNESIHRSIKMTPNSVHNGNSHIVYSTLYPKPYIKKPPVFKIGDAVRHSITLGDRGKKYEGKYSIPVFLIKKIKHNVRGKHPVYMLEKAFSKKEYPGWWYKHQLQKVDKATFASKNTKYDIKVVRTKGKKALVKYVGYEDKPVWVDKSSIIDNFRQQ